MTYRSCFHRCQVLLQIAAPDRQWSGTLGKMLNRVNDLPINPDFNPIPVDASAPVIPLSDEVI